MDYLYKVEIELDDDKIIADGKNELSDIYEEIREIFKSKNIPEAENNEHKLIFATKEKKYVYMQMALDEIGEISIKPYIKKLLWYNNDRGEGYCEDWLYQSRTGDYTSDKAIINRGKHKEKTF